jgi:prepilin-type processing-associated H-X9-DG protein
LRDAGLPTPEIVDAGRLDGGGHYLLTGFIENSRTLADRWPVAPPPDDARTAAVLLPAFRLFGQLHAAGLIQIDPHPGNFLERTGKLFLIDGDGVRRMEGADREWARQAGDNLALLFAQLPPAWDDDLDGLLAAYAAGSARRVPDRQSLPRRIGEARTKRLAHFLDKTLRDCSEFAVQHTARRFCSVVRAERETLAPLLDAPDAAIAEGTLMKDGNTCTVARVDVGERSFAVKRYNLKSLSHALSRCWRPSRAYHAWLAGHRLAFFGIPTPAPLALIEERAGPLRRRAFLVTEFCPGENLLQRPSPEREPDADEAAAIVALFDRLFRQRITHGDMKATNFLWCDGHLAILDLDAMTRNKSKTAFARGWRRDRARFLRNWPADSPLHRWLNAHLPGVQGSDVRDQESEKLQKPKT